MRLQVVDGDQPDLAQVFQRPLDVGAFFRQVLDGVVDPDDEHLRLRDVVRIGIVELQPVADFLQAEAEIFALLDELETSALPP